MTLLATAQVLEEECGKLHLARRSEHRRKRVGSVGQEFLELGMTIERFVTFERESEQRRLPLDFHAVPQMESALNALTGLRTLFVSGSDVDEDVVASARRAIAELAQALSVRTAEAWARYCDGNVPRTQPATLQILKAVLGHSSELLELERLDLVLDAYRASPPVSPPTALADFMEKLARRAELWKQLDIGDLDPEVMSFLLSAPTGATLGQLSTTVVKWLSEQDLQARYRIFPVD